LHATLLFLKSTIFHGSPPAISVYIYKLNSKYAASRFAGHGTCSKILLHGPLGFHPGFLLLPEFSKENNMPLINLVIILVVVGVILWLVNNYIPMDRKIKRILNVVVVIAVIIWLLSVFGLIGPLSGLRVGRHG
jgi:hypothetical protein